MVQYANFKMDAFEREFEKLRPTLMKWVGLSLFGKTVFCMGLENFPLEGPAIIVGNHIGSYKDIATLLKIAPRQIHFTANKEIFSKERFHALIRNHLKRHLKEFGLLLDVAVKPVKIPFVNFVSGNIQSVGSIPVDLEQGKTRALKSCETFLQKGKAIVLLQGRGRIISRDPHPLVSEFRRGPSILCYTMYTKYDMVVPVVPVAMYGTHNPWVVPSKVKVKIGKPLRITDFPIGEFGATISRMRAAMQKRVRILMYDLVKKPMDNSYRLK
jgi:1-acyl-sn-glycerol-3-phosphate acyltransferase